MNDGNIAIEDKARIAVYDSLLSAPRVVDIPPQDIQQFIEDIAVAAYELSRQQGGRLPYTVIREITENFIHAGFSECTVSILDEGNTLRFADQGPGITKKDLVLEPGVSSAVRWMKDYIRGVGSGFPIVREYLSASQGYLSIEDNAEEGVVVTISLVPRVASPPSAAGFGYEISSVPSFAQDAELGSAGIKEPLAHQGLERNLSMREEKTLLLLKEHGLLGPIDLADLLGVSAPTATRVLQKLEESHMVERTQLRKRILSNAGMAYIKELLV
ncbi:MAG: ATP-binding protein [Coriobacteriia bacterium]|nr:ATP-binding protein [Coriobacteriia bacterium]MCL2749686.1 ATP-binding protein [Coriobacteriia bacterium]